METNVLKFATGSHILKKSVPADISFFVLAGRVQIKEESKGNALSYIVNPGDFIGPELLIGTRPGKMEAVALEEVKLLTFSSEMFNNNVKNLPSWFADWIRSSIQKSIDAKHNNPANVRMIYSILSQLMLFVKAKAAEKSSKSLRATLKPIVEEIGKTIGCKDGIAGVVVNDLSSVGLIDLKEEDPFVHAIHIPDEHLYISFLHFLQRTWDMPAGLHSDILPLPKLKLSIEANLIVDAIFSDSELSSRMFDPERAIVHLSIERLNNLYESMSGGIPLSTSGKAISELIKLGVLTKVKDTRKISVFLDLRSVLRINIRRDPINNFTDIVDFLQEELLNAVSSERTKEISLENMHRSLPADDDSDQKILF